MNTVYLDTSGLLPLLDRSDRHHLAVRESISQLASAQMALVTTSYVMVEAGALVRNRLGMKAFRALGSIIERSAEIIWVDESLHRQAWKRCAAEGRQGASLVDWAGFLVMRDLELDTAVAIDKHFERQGITTLPKIVSS